MLEGKYLIGEAPSQVLGLSKRDYFAGLAMQSIVSSHWWKPSTTNDADVVAEQAILLANALIKALED